MTCRKVAVALPLFSMLALWTGCAVEIGEPIDELDPASSLDYEWWDEGPPPGEEAESSPEEWLDEEGLTLEEDTSSVSSALSVGVFQLPFPCGQVWAGQTRTNHSPQNSIDFNRTNDVSDPVVAAASGTVSVVGNTGSSSYGRWIEISHGDGYTTRYAHLNSQAVSRGQRVGRGQRIGTVGSTGGSSGPHLHFELRRFGTAIRPVFNGNRSHFFGTANYRSNNSCSTAPSGANGTIRTSGAALTVRSGPGTGFRAVGSLSNGTRVRIRCHKNGSRVNGTYGSSALWDFIGTGYVSDAYVYTGTDGRVAPWCG